MPNLLRRATALPVLAFVVASSALAVSASPAVADDANTLTVVGTSDVYDSNLVQSVIKPGFEAAYPGVTLNYVSKGTGAAIAYAEAGSASALIVHAASLENQFVDQGYSLEQYGRAIFYGDYVLLGPANDPARIRATAPHDIVGAFEKIAAAGVKGKANLVSRGGTPGTTVQEHAIWALTNGVPLCTVSDLNGGGEAPSTVSGACPSQTANPNWYHTTGLTQGPNIVNGDACNYTGGGCYVFTDRGTYQYLKSQGTIANLGLATYRNARANRGGEQVLVNSFHAYGINPAKFASNPNVQINATGARNFLSWITSSAAQAAIGAYLASDTANGGAPFLPDAQPQVTASAPAASVDAGAPISVSGTIDNLAPGTPALSNVTVTLNFTPTFAPDQPAVPVATTKTGTSGKYRLTYKPTATGTYTVSTGLIPKIEDASLDPDFGDLLSPFTTPSLGSVTVNASVSFTATPGKGAVFVTAPLTPKDSYQAGTLELYTAPAGTTSPLEFYGSVPIAIGATRATGRFTIPAGDYRMAVHYVNDGVIVEGISPEQAVTVR